MPQAVVGVQEEGRPLQMSEAPNDASEANTACIASVIENRAKEVGLAILDKLQLKLYLMQLIETSRYQ